MPMMSIGPIPKAGYVIYAVETSNKLFEVTVTAIFTDRSRQAQAKSRRPGQWWLWVGQPQTLTLEDVSITETMFKDTEIREDYAGS